MESFVIVVKDRALGAFGRPFIVPSLGVSIRAFQDMISAGGDAEMSKHPSDYDLYHLGFYDDESGAFRNCPEPVKIAEGRLLVQVKGEV